MAGGQGGGQRGVRGGRRNMLLHKGDVALFFVFTVSEKSWWKGQGVAVEFYRGEENGL